MQLSCTEEEQVKRVTQLLEDKREKEKDIRSLHARLCECQSKEVMQECKGNANVAVVDLGDVDMGYMTLLSTSVLEKIQAETNVDDDHVNTTSPNPPLLLFICGKDGSDEGSFLFIGDKDVVDGTGKKVAQLFDGRGGGRNGKFQGKGSKIRSALSDVKMLLLESKNH